MAKKPRTIVLEGKWLEISDSGEERRLHFSSRDSHSPEAVLLVASDGRARLSHCLTDSGPHSVREYRLDNMPAGTMSLDGKHRVPVPPAEMLGVSA